MGLLNIINSNKFSDFQYNKISKIDIINYPEGRYEGQIVNNKKEGTGKFHYSNGTIYSGDWKNDIKEGKGIDKIYNEDKYEGDFTNDKREGKGIYYYHNGDKYEG